MNMALTGTLYDGGLHEVEKDDEVETADEVYIQNEN